MYALAYKLCFLFASSFCAIKIKLEFNTASS